MMKLKKIVCVLLTTLIATAGISGCSGADSSKPEGSTGKTDSAVTDTSGKSGTVTEIRFTEWDGGETLKVYESIADAFNKENPDIHVTIMNIPDEYDTKITTMVAGNDIPEISMLDAAALLFPYAEEGIVLNMNDFIQKDASFDSSILMDQFKYNLTSDYLAGYGIGSENICMFFNPALFEKYGVEEPPAKYSDAWDWDTFVENAKKLTIDKNGKNALSTDFDSENIDVYGLSFDKWWAMYMPFVTSNGGSFLSEDGKSLTLTDKAAIDALQKMQDLIYVDHVAPTPTQSQNMPGLSEAIATNKVAMQISGQWSNESLMTDGISYNVAALPKMGDKAGTLATFGSVALMNTGKADAAWEFVKYLLSEGACMPLYQSGLWLPTTAPEYNEEFIKSFVGENHPANYLDSIVAPMMDNTAASPVPLYVRNFNKINDALTPAFDVIWSGEKPVADALAEVHATANEQVDGFFGK